MTQLAVGAKPATDLEPVFAARGWLTEHSGRVPVAADPQLGEMANLSRHHVGRKLASFEAAGWIACGYNRVRLLDAEALAAFAYGDEET
jgi:CRP-like cAMP-binding protein